MDEPEAEPCILGQGNHFEPTLATVRGQELASPQTSKYMSPNSSEENSSISNESSLSSTKVDPNTNYSYSLDLPSANDGNSTNSTTLPLGNDSPSSETANSVPQATSQESPVNGDTVCRICFGGRDAGPLLHACNCKGTIGFAHETCLATWLMTRREASCEICKAPYRRSFHMRQWWKRLPQLLFDDDAAFRGLFLANVLWMCLYFIIMATIPPQSYVVKQVFECVFCIMILLLAVTLAVLLKQGCIFASTMTNNVFRHPTVQRFRMTASGRRRYFEFG